MVCYFINMNYLDLKSLEVKKQIENEIAAITADDLDIFLQNHLKTNGLFLL